MTAAPSTIPSRWSPARLTVPLLVIAAAYVVGAFANAVVGLGIAAIALGLRAAR